MASRRGRPPAPLTTVIERLLLVLKEGVGWRAVHSPDLPWRTVYGHFRHWLELGLFSRLGELLEQPEQLQRIAAMDSTHVKVHRSGCNPQGGQQAQAIGVSRGGLNTKIHALVTGAGEPLKISFTAGNCKRHTGCRMKLLDS
jgi:transposase